METELIIVKKTTMIGKRCHPISDRVSSTILKTFVNESNVRFEQIYTMRVNQAIQLGVKLSGKWN